MLILGVGQQLYDELIRLNPTVTADCYRSATGKWDIEGLDDDLKISQRQVVQIECLYEALLELDPTVTVDSYRSANGNGILWAWKRI